MSEVTDCKSPADSASRKRCQSPTRQEEVVPSKNPKSGHKPDETQVTSENGKNSESDCKDAAERVSKGTVAARSDSKPDNAPATTSLTVSNLNTDDVEKTNKSEDRCAEEKGERSMTPLHQSESAAIAAAEALASLTRGDGEESQEATCSSERGKHARQSGKAKQRLSSKTQAAAADSSTSMHSSSKEDADDDDDDEEEEAEGRDDSMTGSSSTHSSSFASDNEENDDGECAIVSVKMAPEMRQSVTVLAQVQMKLEALEKKSVYLHQRLDIKINRLRRPHLDQRSSIAKTIPGFWVTAVSLHF